MPAVWVAVALLALAVGWLWVDTRRHLGQLDEIAERVRDLRQRVAILTDRHTRGEDGP